MRLEANVEVVEAGSTVVFGHDSVIIVLLFLSFLFLVLE